MSKIKRSGEDIAFVICCGFFGVCLALVMAGVLVYLGQQLLWQLRRADCGSYTVAQQQAGNIPIQCKELTPAK